MFGALELDVDAEHLSQVVSVVQAPVGEMPSLVWPHIPKVDELEFAEGSFGHRLASTAGVPVQAGADLIHCWSLIWMAR